MNASLAKTLLMIAGILGILQGIMSLIGGIVASNDLSSDFIPADAVIPLDKYYCGMIRVAMPDKTAKCAFGSVDRGWFSRVYETVQQDIDYPNTPFDKDALKKLVGYEAVLGYALICGGGWIVAAILALVASCINGKKTAIASGIIFTLLYILFIILFGLVWDSVRKVEDGCSAVFDGCPDFKAQAIRSSREFLAYSICSFALILTSIILTFAPGFTMETESLIASDKSCEQIAVPQTIPSTIPVSQMRETKKEQPIKQPEVKLDVAAKPPVTEAAKEYIVKFDKVNKYLADKTKMTSYADKKFKATDTDLSGKVILGEFKQFVTSIMAKKNLPPPADDKIEIMMKKYDKDKSGSLEKPEFEKMLFDVFMSSREVLIRKYAEGKAASWKGKKPSTGDPLEAEKLGKILRTTRVFYEELDAVAKEVDKDKDATLGIDEVTDLVGRFCAKYKVPVLSKEDIIEVMNDMGRPIKEYSPHDLQMVALGILSISKNLVLPK